MEPGGGVRGISYIHYHFLFPPHSSMTPRREHKYTDPIFPPPYRRERDRQGVFMYSYSTRYAIHVMCVCACVSTAYKRARHVLCMHVCLCLPGVCGMMQVMLLLEPDLCIIDTGVGLACGRVCLFPSVAVVDRCRHERERHGVHGK